MHPARPVRPTDDLPGTAASDNGEVEEATPPARATPGPAALSPAAPRPAAPGGAIPGGAIPGGATLGLATLGRIAPELRPAVDPRELRARVVHFGLGAFHRAHQAVYTENAAARSGRPWGIAAVAPRSAHVVEALRAQDCLYSVTSLTGPRPSPTATRVAGAVVEALGMRTDTGRIDRLFADPEVGVVTLTITEKGYHRRPDTGRLDTAAPEVAADLAVGLGAGRLGAGRPEAGRLSAGLSAGAFADPAAGLSAGAAPGGAAGLRTVVGRVAAGLAVRMRSCGAPITLVSCDNMAANGAALEAVVRDFVDASSWPDRRALLDWMAVSVAFPSTIVDRIVPATTDADRAAVRAGLGVDDGVPVVGEPYRQWVLEDSFAAPRPPWELDGALFVPDVVPYQLTKLRLLNGSHSALAYLGAAAGCATVADALATDWGERLVRGLCAEVAATLPAGGPDPVAYAEDLVERFRNPGIRHLLRQIGSDGSLKIPERWLDALRTLRASTAGTAPAGPAATTSTPMLELALAAWANATRPADDGGQLFGTTDPAAPALGACWRGVPDNEEGRRETVRRLLGVLGAADLAEDDALVSGVTSRLPGLRAGRIDLTDR
ncbi:mannitol dehydrogenase family protein [Streptomyces sp. NRRL F-5135]|uniref:mannitol dehydrogenase family protein n=1 Tax=Streptomyces sp. NRRL F-5135 TaxID=1463858 RepID=UPI00099D6928|nr:mannitol dehydrogenase family protein [Streptomyces sp. NRRL F-5135]